MATTAAPKRKHNASGALGANNLAAMLGGMSTNNLNAPGKRRRSARPSTRKKTEESIARDERRKREAADRKARMAKFAATMNELADLMGYSLVLTPKKP